MYLGWILFRKTKFGKNNREGISHFKSIFYLGRWLRTCLFKCTQNFTITKSGIKEALIKDLGVGDYIAGIRKVDFIGTKSVGAEIARLIGYILGDGVVSKARCGVIIHDKDRKNLEFYQKIIKNNFKHDQKLRKS